MFFRKLSNLYTSDNASDDEKKTIFIHLPKTAGTTFGSIINSQYNANEQHHIVSEFTEGKNNSRRLLLENFINLTEHRKRQIKFIRGHVGYGIHQILGIRNFQYTTILRDPLSQVISAFYYLKNTNLDPDYHVFQNMNLEEYVETKSKPNDQLIRLSGKFHVGRKDSGVEDLNFVKQKVLEEFVEIGIQENFDDFISKLSKKLNWSDKALIYEKKNVNKNKKEIEEIPQSTIDMIIEKNHLDYELYNWAKQINNY